MANKIINSRVVMKHDTSANWALATTFVPLNGEFIVYTDLNKFKIGDGTTLLSNLPFATSDIDDMIGATESSAGVHGLVPAPAAGDQGKFLRGDGTWQPAETVIEVNELPAYATANQKAIYRVPEMTEDVYDWVGTTVPNSGSISSLFINSDNLVPSYMVDKVTLYNDMGYILAATHNQDTNLDRYLGLLDYGKMGGAPYSIWCLVVGESTDFGFIYDEDGEWDTDLLNETIEYFKGKQLLNSAETPFGTLTVGEDNANITGFFSTTAQEYGKVDPAHAVNYKYYIANEFGWQNINNQIEKSSEIVAIPEDTTLNGRIYFDTTKTKADIETLFNSLTLDNSMYIIYVSKTFPLSGEYLVFSTTGGGTVYKIQKVLFDGGQPSGTYILYDDDEYNGWNPEFEGYYDVNTEVLKMSDLSKYSVNQEYQNDKLASLCWLGASCYKFKEFDGTEHPFIYDVKVNGESAVVNNEVSLSIGEKLEIAGSKAGQVVPNTGIGGKYKFNTNLSIEEVSELVTNILSTKAMPYYFIASNSNTSKGIFIEGDEDDTSLFGIYVGDNITNGTVFDTEDGWDPDFDGIVDLSGIELSSTIYGYNIGDKNNELIDLISTLAIPYTYYVTDQNGEKHTFAEDKPIVGTNNTLNSEDVEEIAIGYSKSVYEKYNYISDVASKTIVANSTVTTTDCEVELTLSTLPVDYFINKVTFNGTNYYVPTNKQSASGYTVYEIGDNNFEKYPFYIVIESEGSESGCWLQVEEDGEYTVAISEERPETNSCRWISPTIISKEKALKSFLYDYNGTLEKFSETSNITGGFVAQGRKSWYKICVVTDASAAGVPVGTYMTDNSDVRYISLYTGCDIHKISTEYIEATPTIAFTTSQVISADPMELQASSEQMAIFEDDSVSVVQLDLSGLGQSRSIYIIKYLSYPEDDDSIYFSCLIGGPQYMMYEYDKSNGHFSVYDQSYLQKKLTAGTNITIDANNVISATGGGLDINGIAQGTGTNALLFGNTTNNTATGIYSIDQGNSTTKITAATLAKSDAEIISDWEALGDNKFSLAKGENSHSEGSNSLALGKNSHAEGNGTIASASAAHSEGTGSRATGKYSHAGGLETIASGQYSFAHGKNVISSGTASTAFGYNNQYFEGESNSSGQASLSSGINAKARHYCSTAFGEDTQTYSDYQTVLGRCNADTNARFVIGNGATTENRSNAFEIFEDGRTKITVKNNGDSPLTLDTQHNNCYIELKSKGNTLGYYGILANGTPVVYQNGKGDQPIAFKDSVGNMTLEGNLRAAGLTDGATTKTMTDVLACHAVPTVTFVASQVIGANPPKVQLTNEQAAIIESEDIDSILLDASSMGYYKTFARKSISDSNTIIFSFDFGSSDNYYEGMLIYDPSTKQGTFYEIDLNIKKMGFRTGFTTKSNTLTYNVIHPLNTRYLIVQVMDSNYNTVEINSSRTADNVVTITFGAQPTVDEYYTVMLTKIDYYHS